MEVTLREPSVEAASPRPRMRARIAPRDADGPATTRNKERGAWRREAEASAPRDADGPATTRNKERGAWRREAEASAPRDADGPATTRNKERGAWRRAAEASAPRTRSPVVFFDLESESTRRSVLEAETEPATPHKKARTGEQKAGKASTESSAPWFHPERDSVRISVREAEAEPVLLHKKARTMEQEAGKASEWPTRIPAPWFDPERYGKDLWTEIAKHISGPGLVRLSLSCRWLFNLLADDSIWRHAFFRELHLLGDEFIFGSSFRDLDPPAMDLDGPHYPKSYWRRLYIANGLHAFFRSNNELRCGGFIMDSGLVLMSRIPKSLLTLRHEVESQGTCILTNVRHGVWIIDMQIIKCPGCGIADCKGTTQVLEARHCDLLLEGLDSVQQEDLGQYLVDKEIDKAFCGIINSEHLDSLSTAGPSGVVDISWIGDQKDVLTRSRRSPYAAAMNTNLQSNQGLLSQLEALRVRDDRKGQGQAMMIRIVQTLRQE